MTKSTFNAVLLILVLVGCSTPTPSPTSRFQPPTPTALLTATPPTFSYDSGWNLSEEAQISGKTLVVKGDLIISQGGDLRLDSSTLIMESADTKPPRLEIQSGGNLFIQNSTITAFSKTTGYQMIIDHGAAGKIEGSVIEYVAPNDMSFGQGIVHQHANMGGLTILADGFILKNNILRNDVNQARAVLVAEANDVVVDGNLIYENPNDGIRLAACQNAIVSNNLILNNGTYGIKFMDCRNSRVVGNIVQGNAFSTEIPSTGAGIYLEFSSENILISNNNISGNGRDGLVISESNSNTVDSNTISGNQGYGMNIYGGSSNNSVTNNILKGNRLEGIYREERTVGNLVKNNLIAFPPFSGIIDDYEHAVLGDYSIQSFGDAQASYSFPNGAGVNNGAALQLKYSYSQAGCATSIFGHLGQDWSGFKTVHLWLKPDQELYAELEIAEDDSDVWNYSWYQHPVPAGVWSELQAPLTDFTIRPERSTGDGIFELQGIGMYRLTVCPTKPSDNGEHVVLFDNIQLTK